MKSVKFIYQENEIHFAFNPEDNNVMINATEMAKLFNKRIDRFLRSDHANEFINTLLITPYGGNKITLRREEIIYSNKKGGTWMHRKLALKFAAWLDVKFELWIYDTIDDIVFGHYKKHIEAHKLQLKAKSDMQTLKDQLLDSPAGPLAVKYFEAEKILSSTKSEKTKAIRNQLSLFKNN